MAKLKKPKEAKIPPITRKAIGRATATEELLKKLKKRREKMKKS